MGPKPKKSIKKDHKLLSDSLPICSTPLSPPITNMKQQSKTSLLEIIEALNKQVSHLTSKVENLESKVTHMEEKILGLESELMVANSKIAVSTVASSLLKEELDKQIVLSLMVLNLNLTTLPQITSTKLEKQYQKAPLKRKTF